jgi:hypothetical protein
VPEALGEFHVLRQRLETLALQQKQASLPFPEKKIAINAAIVLQSFHWHNAGRKAETMNSVADWVAKNEAANEDPYNRNDYSRKVTTRLDLIPYATLALLAQRFGYTPTKCAEELLKAAINEAYEASGVNEAELHDFVEAEL